MGNFVNIHLGKSAFHLTFSDGTITQNEAVDLTARYTELAVLLADPAYCAFAESSALAWPNGCELSPSALHRRLDEAGLLRAAAA